MPGSAPCYSVSPTGFRLVDPYPHTYTTIAGPRWAGQTLFSVYRHDFSDASTFPLVSRAIELGLIRINNAAVPASHVIQLHDCITRHSHRHEPPVVHVPAQAMVVYDDGDVIAINKPCTVPVHPCGAYHHNCALHILAYELGLGLGLHTVHRLDRMTSGLCLFTRTPASARALCEALTRAKSETGRWTHKCYLALVKGQPDACAHARWLPDSVLLVDRPVMVVDPKRGVHACGDQGKPAQSLLVLLRRRHDQGSSSSSNSLILCSPLTGRTHQLRLHLQLVGSPIANDYAYGGEDELACPPLADSVPEPSPAGSHHDDALLSCCPSCSGVVVAPIKRPSGIFLHALRFTVLDNNDRLVHDFGTPLPAWAADAGGDVDSAILRLRRHARG